MLRIGTVSTDFRPSHSTIALALLVVMRSTTPRRSVQSILPGRLLLLNAAAARAVTFTLSPRLIIFSPTHNAAPAEYFGWAALLTRWSPAPLVRERPEAVLLLRAKLLLIAARIAAADHGKAQLARRELQRSTGGNAGLSPQSLSGLPMPPPSAPSGYVVTVTSGLRANAGFGFAFFPRLPIFLGKRKTAFEPCIPIRGTTVPTGNDWIHGIKS
jgi:hypothetical protein